ncbi:MAG: ATP-binding cassette domain-containing protein [Streptosporangiales bacterium]|nr:ATP-binding cassette domain-containing protein [Streptosporangiales bacterium]
MIPATVDTEVLRVEGLRTAVGDPAVEVVRGVDLAVAAGETVGVVGESGSGKSLTALSVAGLLPDGVRVTGGSVRLEGREVLHLPETERRPLRGRTVGMVYQDPMTSLNPLMRVGRQIAEGLTAHGWTAQDARARTREVLAEVGMPSPDRVVRSYPHQLSGGMRQRVLIASALAARPRLLIADEPTTALDVTIQRQIVELVRRLRDEYGLAVVWITHDLGVVARVADRILVMYAGRVVEEATTRALFAAPHHPYAEGLLRSIPPMRGAEREPLPQIGGIPVVPSRLPTGCPLGPRCPQRVDRCDEEPPLLDRGESRAACWVPREEWL